MQPELLLLPCLSHPGVSGEAPLSSPWKSANLSALVQLLRAPAV